MNDVDHILRNHAEATAVAPAADGWDRLAARATGEGASAVSHPDGPASPAHGMRPRRPLLWLGIAAALALFVAAAVLVRDDGAEPVATEPGSRPEAAVEGGSEPQSEPPVDPDDNDGSETPPLSSGPPGPLDDRPERVVVVTDIDGDGLGDLGWISQPSTRSALGHEPALLVASHSDPEAVAGSLAVNRADLGPDQTVFYETCCEPAVGEIRAIGLDGTGDRYVTAGEAPSVSPDGTHLAVSRQGTGVVVVPVAVGSSMEADLGDPTSMLGDGGIVRRLAWSPDGSTLAAEVVWYGPEGLIDAVEVVLGATDGSGWRVIADDAGVGVALPAFLADGRLAVGVDVVFDERGPSAAGLAVIDLDTGERQPRISSLPGLGRLEFRSLDSTADGRWIVAASGPNLRSFSGDDLIEAGPIGDLAHGPDVIAW